MNCKERIRAAFAHQIPDRLPKGENAYEPATVVRILKALGEPTPDEIEKRFAPEVVTMAVRLGWDYIGARTIPLEYPAPAPDLAAVEKWRFPDPETGDYSSPRRWCAETDLFIFGQIEGSFMGLWHAFPDQTEFYFALMQAPDLMDELAWRAVRHFMARAEIMKEIGVDGILIADDIAYNTGTMIAPDLLRRFFFPQLAWAVEQAHQWGLPVVFHSDGDLRAVEEDIVATGVDGQHSLQPSANMDIARIKAQIGDRLTLFGNIDLTEVLFKLTPEEVRRVVRETIDAAAPGGGFVLATCNSLENDLPAENLIAMYDEAERYNPYARSASCVTE